MPIVQAEESETVRSIRRVSLRVASVGIMVIIMINNKGRSKIYHCWYNVAIGSDPLSAEIDQMRVFSSSCRVVPPGVAHNLALLLSELVTPVLGLEDRRVRVDLSQWGCG